MNSLPLHLSCSQFLSNDIFATTNLNIELATAAAATHLSISNLWWNAGSRLEKNLETFSAQVLNATAYAKLVCNNHRVNWHIHKCFVISLIFLSFFGISVCKRKHSNIFEMCSFDGFAGTSLLTRKHLAQITHMKIGTVNHDQKNSNQFLLKHVFIQKFKSHFDLYYGCTRHNKRFAWNWSQVQVHTTNSCDVNLSLIHNAGENKDKHGKIAPCDVNIIEKKIRIRNTAKGYM